MDRKRALAIVPFAWLMIGAKDCDPWAGWSNPPPTQTPSPSKPFCYTDPPLGCAAVCTGEDNVTFTPACSNVESGPLELDFQNLIMAKVNMYLMQDQHVCNPSTIGVTITPCQAGITPVEWPNQDHEVCTPAPPGCPL
jgi:hypothetical protein